MVVEAVGADATVALAIDLAGRMGRVSVVGVNKTRAFPVDMLTAQLKCLELTIGLCSVQRELPALLALTTSGRLDPGTVVTHHLPLEAGGDAYAAVRVPRGRRRQGRARRRPLSRRPCRPLPDVTGATRG